MVDEHPNDEPQAEPESASEPEPEPDTWPHVMQLEWRSRGRVSEIERG